LSIYGNRDIAGLPGASIRKLPLNIYPVQCITGGVKVIDIAISIEPVISLFLDIISSVSKSSEAKNAPCQPESLEAEIGL
jgi:hypothetical protein